MSSLPNSTQALPTTNRSRLGLIIKWCVLASAVVLSLVVCYFYEHRPRTDDASVVANVVGIAPRISGPITKIAVVDNQYVKAGDLLFEIDPVPYQDAVDRTAAQKLQTGALLERLRKLLPSGSVTQEQVDEAVANDKSAAAAQTTAQYDLDGCHVTAPFDGYITNLNTSNGAYAHSGGDVLTMVDARHWYVIANFRESLLRHIAPGMKTEVYLMSRPSVPYSGVVESIGRGVVPEEEPELSGLPNVKRELNWVRLAQRFPVRILLDASPTDPGVRGGTSAIVTVLGHDN